MDFKNICGVFMGRGALRKISVTGFHDLLFVPFKILDILGLWLGPESSSTLLWASKTYTRSVHAGCLCGKISAVGSDELLSCLLQNSRHKALWLGSDSSSTSMGAENLHVISTCQTSLRKTTNGSAMFRIHSPDHMSFKKHMDMIHGFEQACYVIMTLFRVSTSLLSFTNSPGQQS